MNEPRTMFKHIVMWDLRGESPEEKAEAVQLLKRKFESLRGQIPGLLHLEVGVDSSRIAYACDVVLYSEFDSQASLDGDLRIARHQVDYAME